jgi:hypothetical protein
MLTLTSHEVKTVVDNMQLEKHAKILEWLSGDDSNAAIHKGLRKARVQNSGQWLLESEEFTKWVDGTETKCLVCSGIRSTLSNF